MSADNWTSCPRCYRPPKERAEILAEAYGSVSREEYEALANRPPPTEPDPTLREDYEIGIREGEFFVSYSAWCQACKFQFKYDHREEVKP